MQEAMRIVLDHAAKADARRVRSIRMRVGEISGVAPDALEFAFHVVSRETPAEGARLDIDTVAVECRCPTCRRDYRPPGPFYGCPFCGTSGDIRRGKEFQIVAIEVD
jgi:hydrogenase nickel incorporation protein HypA/HybF